MIKPILSIVAVMIVSTVAVAAVRYTSTELLFTTVHGESLRSYGEAAERRMEKQKDLSERLTYAREHGLPLPSAYDE